MKKVIINADDLGYHNSVNQGIFEAFRQGVVSSASLMANGEAFLNAVEQLQTYPLPIGIHFNLTSGIPLSSSHKIPTLLNNNGYFYSKWQFARRFLLNKISIKHISIELQQQFQRCLNVGLQPDHFDSHHHIHLIPSIAQALFQITNQKIKAYRSVSNPLKITWKSPLAAFEQGILSQLPYKQYSENVCTPDYYTGMELLYVPDKQTMLLQLLKHLRHGITEIMCHPGYPDDEYSSVYQQGRFQELKALTSFKLKNEIERQSINLISFKDIQSAI